MAKGDETVAIEISDREQAAMILPVLLSFDTELKRLAIEQAGEGAGDDNTTATLGPDGPTYKQRRAQIEQKRANIEREFSSLMPLVVELHERNVAAAEAAAAAQREG